MRLVCPLCGERDRREFYYLGAALARPDADAEPHTWDQYVHLRENPAGDHKERWFHEAGCGSWVVVERNLSTHAVSRVGLTDEELDR